MASSANGDSHLPVARPVESMRLSDSNRRDDANSMRLLQQHLRRTEPIPEPLLQASGMLEFQGLKKNLSVVDGIDQMIATKH